MDKHGFSDSKLKLPMCRKNSHSKLTNLPWFIQREIIDYVVSDDKREFCLVNKDWFKYAAGRFTKICIYYIKLNISHNSIPWLQVSETIEFYRYDNINWRCLFDCKNIKRASLFYANRILSSKPREFKKNLTMLPRLESLKIELDALGYRNLESISFIKSCHLRLKNLDLSIYSYKKDCYEEIFGNLVFSKLRSITWHCDSYNNLLKKNMRNMPNLRILTITLSEFYDYNEFICDFPIPSLIELIILPYRKFFLRLVQFDLTKFPNLKKLALPGKVELINIEGGFKSNIEDIILYCPFVSLSDKIYSLFPYLKKLTIYCGHMDSDSIFTVLKLCDRVHSLTLKNLFESDLLLSLPSGDFTVTNLQIDGLNYLTNQLFIWLSKNFKLRRLELSYPFLAEDIRIDDVQFNHLEYVLIKTRCCKVKDFSSAFFSPEKHPKLKIVKFLETH